MRIFGWELKRTAAVQSAAGPLPPRQPNGQPVVDILPPFGTNPPHGPVVTPTAPYLGERLIHNDPREAWYLALPPKLTPKQVLQILRSALGGDVWQLWQLQKLMMDSWPMFRKCAHEIRQAVAGVKYVVHPCTEDDNKEPSPEASEKAALVRRAMKGMQPNPASDEAGWSNMIYDLTDAMLNGITLTELLWYESPIDGEFLPRAAAWVHPRHYTFGDGGNIVIFDDIYNRLNFNLGKQVGYDPDPKKFIISQFKGCSGSCLSTGLVRPLAWYWSAVVFNRDWMLTFAQKYGNPFLDVTYKPGTPQTELAALNTAVATAGSQGWMSRPEGTTLTIQPAQSLGNDNPQARLIQEANEACQYLLLGQTATSTSTPGKLGNEDTHEGVKREMVQGVAKWIASILSEQFAAVIVEANYGNRDELPTIEADFTGEDNPLEEAERDQIFLDRKVPMKVEAFYKRHNLEQPEDGDKVIVGGQIGLLGSTDEEISLAPQPAPVPGEDFGGSQGDGFGDSVAQASDEELNDLRELIIKAKEAKHVNGEWEAVTLKMGQLGKGRIK